jgi:hypothetical protein
MYRPCVYVDWKSTSRVVPLWIRVVLWFRPMAWHLDSYSGHWVGTKRLYGRWYLMAEEARAPAGRMWIP